MQHVWMKTISIYLKMEDNRLKIIPIDPQEKGRELELPLGTGKVVANPEGSKLYALGVTTPSHSLLKAEKRWMAVR